MRIDLIDAAINEVILIYCCIHQIFSTIRTQPGTEYFSVVTRALFLLFIGIHSIPSCASYDAADPRERAQSAEGKSC